MKTSLEERLSLPGSPPRLQWTQDVTMVFHIKPETQAELERPAEKHGVGPDVYAAALLEDAVNAGGASGRLDGGKLDQFLAEIGQFSQKIPILPDEAFTRESIYRDHD